MGQHKRSCKEGRLSSFELYETFCSCFVQNTIATSYTTNFVVGTDLITKPTIATNVIKTVLVLVAIVVLLFSPSIVAIGLRHCGTQREVTQLDRRRRVVLRKIFRIDTVSSCSKVCVASLNNKFKLIQHHRLTILYYSVD